MYVHSDSASGADVPKWYYANAGTRSGPHSDDEMARLARSGTLGAATLCWTDSYGEQWKPFSQTELGSRVAGDVLPSAFFGVTDVYVWIYAAIPTVGGFIVSFLASAQFGDYATLYLLALITLWCHVRAAGGDGCSADQPDRDPAQRAQAFAYGIYHRPHLSLATRNIH